MAQVRSVKEFSIVHSLFILMRRASSLEISNASHVGNTTRTETSSGRFFLEGGRMERVAAGRG
jgi:hypothetical protein